MTQEQLNHALEPLTHLHDVILDGTLGETGPEGLAVILWKATETVRERMGSMNTRIQEAAA